MRLFLDEGVHLKSASALRVRGIDAEHILEAQMGGSSDQDVLAESNRRGAVLITHDSDFHKILAQTKAASPSVIRLRLDMFDPEALADLIAEVVESMSDLLKEGAVVSVDADTARGRRLPI